MRGDRCRSQVAPGQAGFLVTQEVVEYFAARSWLKGSWEFLQVTVPRKLVRKTERASRYLRFDANDVFPD